MLRTCVHQVHVLGSGVARDPVDEGADAREHGVGGARAAPGVAPADGAAQHPAAPLLTHKRPAAVAVTPRHLT